MESGSILSILNDPTKETRWKEIEQVLADNGPEPGWITGTVLITFSSPRNRQFSIVSAGAQLKITVSCPGYERLEVRSQQKVKIWLKGGKCKESKTSAPNTLPFILVFQAGVAILLSDDELIDLWQAPELETVHEDDWYSTPHPASETHAKADSECDELAPSPPHGTTNPTKSSSETGTSPTASPPPQTPRCVDNDVIQPTLSLGDEVEAEKGIEDLMRRRAGVEKDVRPMEVDESDGSSATPIGEPQVKKRKKRDTRHDPARESKKRRTVVAVENENQSKQSTNDSRMALEELSKSKKLSIAEKNRRRKEYVKTTTNNVLPPSPPKRNPALDLIAGCNTESGNYPALSEVKNFKENTWTQVIGVVSSVEPIKETRKKDISIAITLVDPSSFEGTSALKVTCFMKPGFERFLPTPEVGHILLLKCVKLSTWMSSVNGMTYPERLCWAAFNPSTGKFYHKDEAIISAQNPATGFKPSFNPVYSVKAKEIAYAVKLSEWWRAIQEEQGKGAIQVQEYTRKGRVHALIGDMDPNVFFNATVEVVMRTENNGVQDAFFLFSDFTPHSSRSTQGPFGQYAMSAYTSRVSTDVLNQMRVGTFWSMRNVRLKVSSNGSVELDLYAAELRELSLDNLEEDHHLQALLERRKKYTEEHPFELFDKSLEGNAPVSIVSDISGPGCHTFIAELIYRSFQSGIKDVTELYVTDYSDNELISQYKTESLKRRLKGEPVLRIVYWGNQDDIQNLEDGKLYRFEEVRISADKDGGLKGNTNRADVKIKKVSLRKTSDSDVQKFLARKAAFLSGETVCKSATENGSIVPPLASSNSFDRNDCAVVKTRHYDQLLSSIRMIRVCDKCPNKFLLKARVVDFYPLELKDFTQRRCKSCKQRIPDNRHACTMCDDMEHKFVEWVYRFFLRLQDEDGETIDVAVCDEGKQFLSLPPCDLTEGDNLDKLQQRVGKLLGNVVEAHERLKEGEKIDVHNNPLMNFAIKSWEVKVGSKSIVAYVITGSKVIS